MIGLNQHDDTTALCQMLSLLSSLTARHGHVPEFWPMSFKEKSTWGLLRKVRRGEFPKAIPSPLLAFNMVV